MNDLRGFFAPTGTLRAAINMGNAVLAHSHTAPEKPAGVTIDLSR
ncbi:MAG: ABC transporter substrate-binding protein, partial [Betaproteobacteria bacterium]|nr:ABC transporter substrate-binding protein [Betaproteobacteria bacterium]